MISRGGGCGFLIDLGGGPDRIFNDSWGWF